MTTTTLSTVDERAAEAFAGRLVELFTGGALTYMIDLGHRCGLFDVAAAAGPVTSVELAQLAGLQERYVREWLAAMVTGGVFEHDEGRYWLPREHAVCLTGDGVENLTPLASLTTVLAEHVPAVAHAFRVGGGVPYDAFLPGLHDVMDALWGPVYDHLLVDAIVPLVPGLHERLTAGGRCADIACGTGRAITNLAVAYPASTFTGYDLDPTGLERGRARTEQLGLANVTFHACDAATLTVDDPLDAIFIFNAVHDQVAPAAVLARAHDALRSGGTLVLDEPGLSRKLEDNLDHPLAPYTYAVSTLHCLTVSLAGDGAGLGTVWGHQTAVELLGAAGFVDVTVHDAPGDPGNNVFVATKARSR